MNKIQLKIIELSTKKDIWHMSLRAIGTEIGVKNAATVKYHLEQLQNKSLLKKPSPTESLTNFKEKILRSQESILTIPILGSANCGEALLFANEMLEGYLKISQQLAQVNNSDNIFAVRAQGDSMNKSNIKGAKIESGDYVLVDSSNTNAHNNDYVLSVIDGCANIKKLVKDDVNNRLILLSESDRNYPPIYIHPEDSYLINGTVVSVIKAPNAINS